MHSGTFLQQLRKVKGFKYSEHSKSHHKKLHVVFIGSSEWMNYTYTLWWRSANFPKSLRPFKKPTCQQSDIKKLHNLKFRQCVGVVAHNLKVPSVCLSPHTELCSWQGQIFV